VSRFLGFLLLSAPLTAVAPLATQSLLDRPPNVSGDWVAPVGTVQFNFLHRFVASSAPARRAVQRTSDYRWQAERPAFSSSARAPRRSGWLI
jgi:hypothetical protein